MQRALRSSISLFLQSLSIAPILRLGLVLICSRLFLFGWLVPSFLVSLLGGRLLLSGCCGFFSSDSVSFFLLYFALDLCVLAILLDLLEFDDLVNMCLDLF